MPRTSFMHLVAPFCAVLALAGCKRSAETGTAPAADASTAAAPDAKPGIALSGVRIALPPVAGNPAALYFTVTNSGSAAAKLAAVHVAGAGNADMHQTVGGAMKPLASVDLAPGATAVFSPGGKHVMVYGLPKATKPGDTPEVTLTFADGDKISAKATVQPAGGGDGVMGGMKM